ncbi:hypothetical protein RY27_21640 [Litorilinea aerophila]|nr:hypothetical protein RY27_21640 [Litorilinea aerophila]
MQTIKGVAASVIALIACPCHLPLTIPLLLALTSGTALGLWLASNQWLIWMASFVLFLGGLLLAVNWLGQGEQSAQCQLPAPPSSAHRRKATPTSNGHIQKRMSGAGAGTGGPTTNGHIQKRVSTPPAEGQKTPPR